MKYETAVGRTPGRAEQTGTETWAAAWAASPGPRTRRAALLLWLKGFCMGTADIIPGVSGGTIAFITGIYESLLAAIASFDLGVVQRLLRRDVKGALARAHVRFILPLVLGIGIALVSTARLMHHLLEHHPVPTWSLFFGLILGSILFVGRKVDTWREAAPFLVTGTVGAYLIVGMIPRATPETWWFVFLSGMIAICAMILPGISGSFILLILGKYLYVTGALKNPFAEGQLSILVIFGLGAAAGIAVFSRVLGFLLRRYGNATIALLTGFMIGAMRRIWPWQEVLREEVIGDKHRVLETQNVLPQALDAEVFLAAALALLGFSMVIVLQRLSRSGSTD